MGSSGTGGESYYGTSGSDRDLTENIENKKKLIGEDTLRQLDEVKQKQRDKLIQDMISSTHPDEIGVAFLEVGQGDCSVVKLPNGEIMVIDCNTENANVNIVDFLRKTGIKKIDYLVITHPHYDHTSGMKEISQNFEIKEVWISDFEPNKEKMSEESYKKYVEYKTVIESLEKKGTVVVKPTSKREPYKVMNNTKIYCYGPSASPSESTEEDIHANSMVLKLEHGKSSILFVGDINNKGWERLKNYYGNDLKSTIFHASHHGSESGCDKEAMEYIKPQHTVVSVGENKFGHPDASADKVYQRASKKDVWYTDAGTIGFRLNSQGEHIVIQKE